jgi:hypothetical protein
VLLRVTTLSSSKAEVSLLADNAIGIPPPVIANANKDLAYIVVFMCLSTMIAFHLFFRPIVASNLSKRLPATFQVDLA